MRKRWVKHFLFWLAYHAFEVYADLLWIVNKYDLSVSTAFSISFKAETLMLLAIKLPMVYIMFFILSKYSSKKVNVWQLVLLLSLVLILFTAIAQVIIVYILSPTLYVNFDIEETFGYQGVINSFMDKIFIACLAISLKQMSNTQRLREREQFLMKEKLEAELNFLKSQINPHFLFNTLNNIYSLARKKSDKTPEVVVKLSKLLRFVLYENKNQYIYVEKELEFLKNYVELHKIRYDDRLKIVFKNQIDDRNSKIKPLLLMPFVENAFKHGVYHSTGRSYIYIELIVLKNKLTFKVENSFDPDCQNIEEEDGIGLKNLKRQLELMYPKYHLETKKHDKKFLAEIFLDLNQGI